jgi:hypothetical protein
MSETLSVSRLRTVGEHVELDDGDAQSLAEPARGGLEGGERVGEGEGGHGAPAYRVGAGS